MKTAVLILAFVFLCALGFAQSMGNYTFAYSAGTYTEITGGTQLGNESTADQRFVDPAVPLGGTGTTGPGFPIGFNFYFGGYEYDRVGVCADGWIALGQSWEVTPLIMTSASYTAPLGSTSTINPSWQVSRIAGLALNLAAQSGATLRLETVGTAPYRIFVAQWKSYRKSGATGDSFSFQIRLEETTNKVGLVYGTMINNATATAAQVGLRGEPATTASNFANRTTTTDWSATTAGAAAGNTCTLSSTVYPASGATFTWTPPSPLNTSYTVGSGGSFTTVIDAVNFLNTNYALYGIPEGGTVFNLLAGSVFAEDPPALTATGSPNRPITFQKSGTGANPLIKPTGATGTTDACFRLNGGDYFTFNNIDIANNTGTTSLEIGFYLVASNYNGCHHNTISNCTVTLSRTNANTKAVYSVGASYAGNNDDSFNGLTIADCNTGFNLAGNSTAAYHNDGNQVSGCVMTDISAYGIYFNYCTDLTVYNNSISMCAGNATEFHGIHANSASNTTTAEVSYNNLIGNTTSARVCGFYAEDGTVSWHHNTIHGFTGTGTADRFGIYIYDKYHEVYDNEIYGISATGHVYGIYTSSYADVVNIYNNEIHDIKYTGPTSSGYTATGIVIYGTTITVANNMIYDIGSTGDTPPMIRGIATVTGTNFNIYYNTIYLKGGGTNTNFGSAGLYLTNVGPTLDIRNNIVIDLSTPGTAASGKACAIWKAYSGFANFATTSDRNIYYAGTPGAKNLICYDNGSAYQTLTDYKYAVASCELGSLTESVPFVSVAEPYDLHVSSSIATLVEGNALPITGWDFDFDNNNRNDSTPDIGADEGNFLVPAVVPDPALVISPVDGEIVVSPSVILNWTPASTGGTPTGYLLYFGTNDPPSNIANGIDLGNVTSYDPSPDLAFLTTYHWRIVPYNATGSTPLASCPVWSFETHAAPLTGTYTIGSAGYYPSFTLAITHLNAAGVGSGGVTFQAAAGEIFAENPPIIEATGTLANPIVFTRYGTGANPKITPTGGTDTYAIRINGGDYITFEYIDVANLGAATNLANGYWFWGLSGDGPNYDTIRYCNVTLSRNVTSHGVYITGASGSGTYTGIAIQNNAIDNATYGMFIDPANEAYDMLIQNNAITNATTAGIYLRDDNNGQVTGNNISFPASATAALDGIYVISANNTHVSGNTISGGSTTNTCYGLSANGGTTYWHGNTVTNLHGNSGMEGFNGIGGTIYIYNNEFSALSTNNTLYGLELSLENTGTAIAYNNRIHNLSSVATGAQYVEGILSGGTNNKFYNNMIYDLRNPGASTAPQVIGLQVSSGTASLYYNTMYLDTSGTNASFSATVLYLSSATSLLLNNNIFMNSGTPGASGKMTAFWKTTDGFANISAASDYNIYYAGTPGTQRMICFTPSAAYQTLDDYKAGAATFDQNSLTEAVPFMSAVSPYDVHITPGAATLAESNATPIAEVTADFDGDTRNALTPDIGADEGNFAIPALRPGPAVVVSPQVNAYAVSINPTFSWYASASGGTPTGYKIWFGSDNPPSNIVNGTDLGNVLSYASPVTLNYLTTYYWKIIPYNENGDALDCPVWNFSTHQVPLTGNWIIGSTGYYPDFTHAINYLNASGVGAGGVTFKAIAGEVFAENPPAITATGTAADPIVFASTDTLATHPKITPTGGTGTFGIKLEGGDFVTFHHIDIANTSGSTTLLYGFWLEAQTSDGCTDNTIRNCSVTLNSATEGTFCIRSDSASSRINHRNRFLNNTLANSRYGIYLYDTSAANSILIQGNTLTGITDCGIYDRTANNITISGNSVAMAASNTRNFYGIQVYNDSATGLIYNNVVTGATTTGEFEGIYCTYGDCDIYGNTVATVSSSKYIYGIRNYYSGNGEIYNNTITALACTGSSYYIYGIYPVGIPCYLNTVHNLSSAGSLYGIVQSSGSCYRNKVYNLQSNATGGYAVQGIHLAGTTTAHNNLVYDLRAPTATAVPQVRGIQINGTVNACYNSVLLTATGSAATFSTAALFIQGGTTIKLKNNIFSDRSTPGASGKAVALWKEDAGWSELSTETNNNIWWAGTPGAQHLICQHASLSYITLEDYKLDNLTMDQNSFTELTPFMSAVSPFDLHINPALQTYACNNGLVVSGMTVDFDGDTRDTSHPDIGADEGNFTPIAAVPAIPVYLSPANGATNQALNIALSWSAGSGGGVPDYYNVYLGTSTPPPLYASNVTTTSYHPTLLPSHTYYWKIDAVNTLGTATGPIWSFTTRTDDTIMEYPFLESFEVGNTGGSTTINRWTQALGSGSYYWTANTATTYNRTPRTGSYNLTLRDSGDAWLFRPIYLQQGQSYELELWARQYTSSGAQAYLQVRYGTAASIASMTNTIINIQEFVNGSYQRASGVFTPSSTGIWYLGIHGVCINYINFLSLDDIGVDFYAPAPVFSVSPTSYNFGMVNVGTTSATQGFTVTNIGDADLIINQADVLLTGTNTDEFVLTDPGSDVTITPGNSYTYYVSFAPLSIGGKSAYLQITDNSSQRALHQIPLSGRGVGPFVPPFVEDFEEGWTDWALINGSQANKWELGTAAPYRNSYSAYISSNLGATHSYNPNSGSYTHIYHDITFPANMTGLTLKFNWKCAGEPGFDYLTVHITDTSFVPVAGEYFTTGQIGSAFVSSPNWQRYSLALDPSYAGATKRLIFSWHNDGGGGTQPPAAIDNIRVHSTYQALAAPQNAYGFQAGAGNIGIAWDPVPNALDYIIEEADMFDSATFTYVGCSGNPSWTWPGLYPRRFFRVRATD